DSKDSVWVDTYDRGLPERTFIADSAQISFEDGITQIFRMLSKGDSAVFDIAVSKLYKDFIKQPIPEDLDSTLMLTYHIKINDILDQGEFELYSQKLMQEYFAKQQEVSKKQMAV